MADEVATFAGGCFWCTEAIFLRLKGVLSVVPGYSGGHVKNPSYEQVTSGATGHAEAINITFNPQLISYERLLDIFWQTHNPTTLNQQGNDIGPQYRSEIFYHSPHQQLLAESSLAQLKADKVYPNPVVTKITPFTHFYPAEDYHRNYYDRNSQAGYCSVVISPKIKKLLKTYASDIKPEFK